MSEADSILFGRAELERAFTALGERLVRRGVVADIFIVGGAAMALATTLPASPAMSMPCSNRMESSTKRPCGSRMTWDSPLVAQRAGKHLHLRQGRR